MIRFLFLAAVAAPIFAQTYTITPFLTCVDVNSATNTMTAYFGYESREQAIVQVLVGNDNRFVPSPANRGEPTLFLPGLFERAFRVTLDATQITQWVFLGLAVTVSRDSNPCQPAVNYSSLPPASVNVPYSQQLVSAGSSPLVTWTATTGLPAGLGLSGAGVLGGTPLVAGTYLVGVRASDGTNSDTRTYQLTVVGTLAINDIASTRAPGFTPQFRLVTNVSAAIQATAQCGGNEFVLTGGGTCTVPNVNTVQGRVASSQPSSNGWTVVCSGGTATAVAVCQTK